MADLNAFMDSVNEYVTGTVTAAPLQGQRQRRSRASRRTRSTTPELAGFGESGGLFSQQASPGFIELWSLQSRMAHRVTKRGRAGRSKAMFYKALGFVDLEARQAELRRRYGRSG